MRKWIKKVTQVLLITAATCFILALLVIQLPWFKIQLATQTSKQLSKLTQSEVVVESFHGFLPFSFNLSGVSLIHKKKTWLKADQISLHQSLLKFFLLKNKQLDLTIESPQVFFIPDFNPEKPFSSFNWPAIPFRHLSVAVNAHNLQVAHNTFNRTLPQNLNANFHFNLHKYGRVFHAKADIKSKTVKEAELKLRVKGFQKHNRMQVKLAFSDPSASVGTALFSQTLPPMDLQLSLSGAPNAIIGFTKPSYSTVDSFHGQMNWHLYPTNDNALWKELIGNKKVEQKIRFNFTDKGMDLDQIEVQGDQLNISGSGFLSRDFQLENTELSGRLSSLKFTEGWFPHSLKGKVDLIAKVKGSFQAPNFNIKLQSDQINYNHTELKQVESCLLIEQVASKIMGQFQASSIVNENLMRTSGFYHYTDPSHFELHEVEASYGPNKAEFSTIKKLDPFWQINGELSLEKIALFSAFLKEEIHGNYKGSAALDLSIKTDELIQSIKLNGSGSKLQFRELNLSNYNLMAEGQLKKLELEQFYGDLHLQAQECVLHNLNFDDVNLFVNASPKGYLYKVDTQGELSIFSTGTLHLKEDALTLDLRALKGSIAETSYSLLHPSQLSLNHRHFQSSPLFLKVGEGQILLSQHSQHNDLKIHLKNFPVQAVTFFTPGYDIRGEASVEGYLHDIFSKTTGAINASFSKLHVEDFQDKRSYYGNMQLKLSTNSLSCQLDVMRNEQDYTRLKTKIPLKTQLFPLQFKFSPDASLSGLFQYSGDINPFLKLAMPHNHFLEGFAQANLSLSGSMIEPKIKGPISLCNGYYENFMIGLVLKNATVDMQAKGKKIILNSLKASDDNEGRVSCKGNVDLSYQRRFPFLIDIDLKKAQILQLDFLTGELTGKGEFEGNLKKAHLQGDFKVDSALVTLPSSSGSNLPDLPVQYVYKRKTNSCSAFQTGVKHWPIYFDIDLTSDATTTIQGRGIDSLWTGNLSIQGTDLKPKFKGKLESTEGSFDFAGRFFDLTQGSLICDGHITQDTTINLVAESQINEYQVLLNLKGPLQGPYLNIRSEPALNQQQVLALVLYGQTGEELDPFQAVALTHTLATLGGVYLGPGVVEKLRKGIGLDQLSLGSMMYNDADYTTIQVGKYITRSILITLHRPITQDPSPFVITAQYKGGLQFQTYFDQSQLSKLLLQWRFSY